MFGPAPTSSQTDNQAAALQISFEFFPPNTEKLEQNLWTTVQTLAPFKPDFVSVTYGAGGSTRDRTHKIVKKLVQDYQIDVAAHLTCIGASEAEISEILDQYWQDGIHHIVALRGDVPDHLRETDGQYRPLENGFAYATDLVAGIKRQHPFDISVACYPEAHPEAPSASFDMDILKQKQDLGAKRAISQFFFDNDLFLRFRDQAVKAGITIPILPGILPISNFKTTAKFAKMCGTTIPNWLADMFNGLDDDPVSRQLVSASIAADQCLDLTKEGVSHFHFYTLNRWELSAAVCRRLGLTPEADQQETDA